MSKLEKKIKMLGIDYDGRIFNTLRELFAFIIFIYLLFSIKIGYIIAPIVSLLFYFLCEYIIIDIPLRKKNVLVEKEGIKFVSALLLNLKNGKSIRVSIKNSSKVIKGELSAKFVKVLNDVKIGLTMEEALTNLSREIPSVFLQNIILNLKENTKYGTDIIENIEWQLEAMEEHYEKVMIGRKKLLPIKLCLNTLLFLTIMILFLLYYIK